LALDPAATDQCAPNEKKNVLKETFAKANVPAETEGYANAAHGWCPPRPGGLQPGPGGEGVERLLALYGTALE
jgi:carboxymethylenebutenolidase